MAKGKPMKPRDRLKSLNATRSSSLRLIGGAWWWPFMTPTLDEDANEVYLKCEICGTRLTPTSASKVARAHMLKVHKYTNTVRPTPQEVDALKSQYNESNKGASAGDGSQKTPRECTGLDDGTSSDEDRPRSLREPKLPVPEGFNFVGIPAQCRRECYTEPFKVSTFQEHCSNLVKHFSDCMASIPEIDSDSIDIDVADLSFAEQYEKCSVDVDVSTVDLNTTSLMRKSGFCYDTTEKKLREGEYVQEQSDAEDFEGGVGRESDLLGGLLEESGGEGPSRKGSDDDDGDENKEKGKKRKKKSKKRKGDEMEEEELEDEPWMETLKKVHGCMEKMAKKMFCVHDMLASNNIRTGGMYRSAFIKICHKIAEHLEENEGRVFRAYLQPNRTFTNINNTASEKLTAEEAKALDEMIAKMEKHIQNQYALIESGKKIKVYDILSTRSIKKFRARASGKSEKSEGSDGLSLSMLDEAESERKEPTEGTEDEGATERAGGEGGSEPRMVSGGGRNRGLGRGGPGGGGNEGWARGQGLEVNKDVVVLIKICPPSLHKVKELHFLAAGHHTLQEIFSLVQCQLQLNMERIGQSILSSYYFMEGTFYNNVPAPDAEDYTKNIKEFCEQNDCGFPLDPGKIPPAEFKDSDFSCTVNDLLLRVSNQPLYILCHHGSCEHLVQIVDVRLCHKSDPIQLKHHPIRTNKRHDRRRKCVICQKNQAEVVTHGDGLAVTDPGFFCVECFECLHYDEWGNLQVKPFVTMPYNKE
ncbi:hypothetical protein BSKO_03208 [Bryopsis sp. KO-2023]|nr:hypothetical protein BSKO_03208 [Bryopsis sp. KO-2023]